MMEHTDELKVGRHQTQSCKDLHSDKGGNWMGEAYLKTSLHQKESGIGYLDENGTMFDSSCVSCEAGAAYSKSASESA